MVDLRTENTHSHFISTFPEIHFRRFPVFDRKAHPEQERLQIVLWVLEQIKQNKTVIHWYIAGMELIESP